MARFQALICQLLCDGWNSCQNDDGNIWMEDRGDGSPIHAPISRTQKRVDGQSWGTVWSVTEILSRYHHD